ncbi:P-loop containing nucleoside triphosphate hydrolase protein [Pyrenochaeta sp. MPI-SDFR-AT-0127]|nr:P-loop containing nucleoside triphosphate hydrolase protein [Pyrenochaeta sp. MPI-SDFR-AT-0127]
MVVNIVFPLKYGLLGGQRRALVSMSSALSSGMHKKCQDGTLLQRNDLSDLEEPAVARNVSTGILKEVVYAPHNDWARQILFPTEADGTLQFKLRNVPHRDLFDHAINYEQAHAVNDICINAYGTLPYLISGPPGTGKTKTLVEATMQLLNTTNIAHMIICAPSEAAADTIALRLKKYLETTQLFRLNRPGRADNEVPHELMQYCHIENDMFHLPPFKTLMAFNVIVTSCRDAAILADARVTNDDLWSMERNILSAIHPEDRMPPRSLHWGALLIDEAAQATELDVLPAINVVRPPLEYPSQLPQPLFVMAGDENQLGPKTASRDPRFCTSLFSRLFDRPLFKNHPLSRSNIKPTSGPPVLKKSMLPIIQPSFTLLVRNYRSHPAILSVPSSLFYNDTLIPEAPMPSTPLQQFSLWRGRKWPVLFIPHDRPDEIEHDGGGWYNISEARMACWIAQQLVIESEVQESDICIMSPFAAQVKLLRALIRSNAYGNGRGLWKVNIGPLEAFQGLENRVVIICTTRTRDRFLKTDEERGFGIVHQKRKMNVALTRAKEALFVIGSPKVLAKDEHWRSWMAFCSRNGLVSDDGGVWKPEDKKPGKEKNTGKALGAGAASHDLDSEYEAWVESLREALDEEDNDTVIEDEDEGGYDGEDAADGTEECSSRNGDKQDVGSDSECQS